MHYLDKDGNYSKKDVINGIIEIDNQIQEEVDKDVVDKQKLTKLRFEQMLRGLYLFESPYQQ